MFFFSPECKYSCISKDLFVNHLSVFLFILFFFFVMLCQQIEEINERVPKTHTLVTHSVIGVFLKQERERERNKQTLRE